MNARDLTETDRRMIRLHTDWLHRTGATERTVHHRRENLRRLATRLSVELLAVTPAQLDGWQSAVAQTVCTSSVATYTNHARSFYRWAVDVGHLDNDPCIRLPRPRVPARSARPIPEKDLATLLDAAPEPLRTWLLLAGYMGLRSHEIAQIRREDITERDGRMYLSGVGKGRKPFTLAVPLDVAPSLAAHLTSRPGPLWRSGSGAKLASRHTTTITTKLMRDLGMPYTLHCLRHRFGTAMYGQTRDLLITQQAMRHSSPMSTRLYVATADGEAVAAMDRLSKSLRAKPGSRKRKSPPAVEAA